MRFRTVHKTASYLLAGLGILVLALGNILHPAIIVVSALAAVGSWWAEEPLISRPGYIRGWTIALVVLLFVQITRIVLGGSFVECGIEFALVLQVSRLWNRRGAKDYQQIVVLALVHLIASSVLDQSVTFAFLFVGFVLALPWTMTMSHLRREIEGNYRRTEPEAQRAHVNRILNSRRIVGGRFLWATALLSVPIFLLSGSMFLLFPRVGLGFLAGGPRRRITVAGFSDEVRLGDLGVVRNNDTVVMRVEVDPVSENPPPRLNVHWRGTAYDEYDGRGWTRSKLLQPRELMPRAGDRYCFDSNCSARGLERKIYTIYLEDLDPPVLLIPQSPRAILMQPQRRGAWLVHRRLFKSPMMEVRREAEPAIVIHYQVETPSDTRVAFATLEEDVTPYLQLPDLSPEVEALARRVVGDFHHDPLLAATKVAEHLRTNYRYTLDLRGTSDEQPLEDFLINRQAGHCEFFSTAMAVMLRVVGVPTRNVTGFLGGRLNRFGSDGAYYAVTQSDAHSWVEVYAHGIGWVTFDPTPPSRGGGREQQLWSVVFQLLDATELAWEKNVIAYDLDSQIELFGSSYLRARAVRHRIRQRGVARGIRDSIPGSWVLALGLAAVALVAFAVALRRRGKGQSARSARRGGQLAQAASLLALLDRALARCGFPRPSWRTPAEHAQFLGRKKHPAADLVGSVVSRYYEVRFGARRFRDDELAGLRGVVREISELAKQRSA